MGGGEQIIFSLLLERRASLVQEMQLMTKISFRFPGPMMPAREMAAIISGKARNLSVMGMNSSSSCLLFAFHVSRSIPRAARGSSMDWPRVLNGLNVWTGS